MTGRNARPVTISGFQASEQGDRVMTSDNIPPEVDPASWVSQVRDQLIPRNVQRLANDYAGFAKDLGVQVLDRSLYGEFLHDVRATETLDTLRDLLLWRSPMHDLVAMQWSLLLLEENCREGIYRGPLPSEPIDVAHLAASYMVEQSR
jgi:hypothetical protein